MAVHNLEAFKQAIKTILESDEGLSIESDGDIYIRSLGPNREIATGEIDGNGRIVSEIEHGFEIDVAIEHFCSERIRLGHGSLY